MNLSFLSKKTNIIILAPPTKGIWHSNDYVNALRLVDYGLIFYRAGNGAVYIHIRWLTQICATILAITIPLSYIQYHVSQYHIYLYCNIGNSLKMSIDAYTCSFCICSFHLYLFYISCFIYSIVLMLIQFLLYHLVSFSILLFNIKPTYYCIKISC